MNGQENEFQSSRSKTSYLPISIKLRLEICIEGKRGWGVGELGKGSSP